MDLIFAEASVYFSALYRCIVNSTFYVTACLLSLHAFLFSALTHCCVHRGIRPVNHHVCIKYFYTDLIFHTLL